MPVMCILSVYRILAFIVDTGMPTMQELELQNLTVEFA